MSASPWWIWRPVQERLIAFGQALIAPLGQKYRIVLKPGQSFCSPEHHQIQIDPESFPGEPPRVQFLATQGVVVHEAGHALFSNAWPEQNADALCRLANFVEDERVERLMRRLYPGVAEVLDLRCRLRLAQSLEQVEPLPPAWQAFGACLVWRWAKRQRLSQRKMSAALKFDAEALALWRKIRRLVEEAWDAPDTAAVIELARRILDLLGIPPATPTLPFALPEEAAASDIPRRRGHAPLPAPDAPDEGYQPAPAEAGAEVDQDAGGDEHLQAEPYLDLEAQALPCARQLFDVLQLPEPDVRPSPTQWRGRYSFRQEMRTPETPCLQAASPARAARSLAVFVLVDRSGSMEKVEADVRLALMALYLAATQLGVPTGIAAFGANHDADEARLTFSIASLKPYATEAAKALIAGYRGTTDYEFLDWGLTLAEAELTARPERRKLLIVIHDGDPIYAGWRGDDRKRSLAHRRQLEAQGIAVIGVYLGDEEADAAKLRQLFEWLIVTAPEQLPERLGDLLQALI